VTDAQHTIVAANSAFTSVTGYTAEETIGRDCRFLQGRDTDPDTVHAIGAALAAGRRFSGTLVNYRKDGEAFWNELSIAPLTDGADRVTGFISVQRDVTELVQAKLEARERLAETETQRATLGALLNVTRNLARQTSTNTVLPAVAGAILTLCGADRSSIALWDSAESRLTMVEVAGWEGRLLEKIKAYTLTPGDSAELAGIVDFREPVLVTTADASDWGRAVLEEFELTAFAAVPMETGDSLTGVLIANWATTPGPSRLDSDLQARLSGLAGITATAIQNARLIDQVRWSASHDPLTGLANRDLLESRLSAALDQQPDGPGLAVIFCDVDGFKRTNDSFGHATGDVVLQQIAARLHATLRGTDLVARIGGDEFVILLTPLHAETEVEAVLRRLDEALRDPIRTDEAALSVRLATGVALHWPSSPRITAASLIQAADADMYLRKARRGLRGPGAAFPEQLALEIDLASAVERGQIVAHYQPQLDLETGRVVAVEALARWEHPEFGTLQPDQFIPLAEATGLIRGIGRYMLRTACHAAVGARRRTPHLTMSVNVSSRELTSPAYAQELHETLAECGLPSCALTLEITESHLTNDQALLEQQVHALRAEGVGIALDDFGTGYTAIAQLQTLPITELKVDRSFIQRAPTPGADLVAGIIALAHELHLTVVAEGVETAAQLARLRSVGCDRAQGYAIGRPVPVLSLELPHAVGGAPTDGDAAL
jgi:diguanylate cyclase (GGDEF)-like protein/PAS domain S-box-containing protein